MAYLDPKEAYAEFKTQVFQGIQQQFPIKGKVQTLELESLEADEKISHDDLSAQQQAKETGATFATPVYGNLVLKNNFTGEVISKKRMHLANVPKETQRYSYIMDGQEYQVDNQWQLKPGAYVRRRANGELETRFNIKGGNPFDIVLDEKSKQFVMDIRKAKVPVYPVMKALGVDDAQLEQAWGKDVLEANRRAHGADGALVRLHKTVTKRPAESPEAARAFVQTMMQNSRLRPEVTESTLGKPFEHVNGDALFRATSKMLKVQSGQEKPDDRDSIIFKDLRSAADFAREKLDASNRKVIDKASRKINTTTNIRDIVSFDTFNEPIRQAFIDNAAVRTATQINPLEMVSSAMQTTLMGTGGIKSDRSVTDEAKFINDSHFGFLDPIATPESSKCGVSLRLPMGIKKIGNTPHIPLYNIKTGKTEFVPPQKFMASSVVLPDQVKWVDGKPVPIGEKVRVAGKGNEFAESSFKRAEYVMRHSSQLFNTSSNLIPFIHNTSGNRASMATRHMEQAISLEHREAPLVQVGTGVKDGKGDLTFEKVVGSNASQRAPIAGVVKEVKPGKITIQGADGKLHDVPLYNNYPLNDAKGVMHSDPRVKVGDKVSQDQVVADTNFSKDGTLALGTNLRVAYLPYKGYNFEDGVVISESAAQKMASVHMSKPFAMTKNLKVGKNTFLAQHTGIFKKDQVENIGDDGIIRIGARVKPGDPLLLATKPFELKDRQGIHAIRKSVTGAHSDASMTWQGQVEGEVVGITRKDGGVQVHVRTVEPMQVGDKLCYDEQTEVLTQTGWKPIADVNVADAVCCLADGEIKYEYPIKVHRYETGGRMYRIKSQQVDLFVTENHDMYVKRRDKNSFELLPAQTIFGKRVQYKKNGHWNGEPMAPVKFPALRVVAGQYGHGERDIPELVLPAHTYLMLLGMYLSDGNIVNHKSSGNYGIDITKIKEPNRSQMLTALDAAEIRYCATSNNEKIRIYSKQLMMHFAQFGHAKDKYIPREIFNTTRDDLLVLFKWLMWGDGNKDGGAYSTISKRLADDFQRLCLHIGKAGNIKYRPGGEQTIRGQKCQCAGLYQVRIVDTKLEPRVNHGHVKRQKVQEEYWVEDYKSPVFCVTVPSHVLYVRRNGITVWSGNSGRFGNKGIVTTILPNEEMPKTKDGRPIEVALNPTGVPGRMNVGQILETAATKIAEKTGKTFVVNNFDSNQDMVDYMQRELKKHGLKDKEELVDPISGQSLGEVMVGKQHILKLVHQVDKKVHVTPGMTLLGDPTKARDSYDLNLMPHKGQAIGSLGVYAMLAHGAKANLREMQTWKSEGEDPETDPAKQWPSQHLQVWTALQTGQPLPTPKPTFAYRKFEDMLRGTGINIEKQGHELILTPMTDKDVRKLAGDRVIPNPGDRLEAKIDKRTGELKTKKGGLFDPKLTGGHGGRKWSRIELAEPMPNPIFEAPIRALTGLKQGDFDELVAGTKGIDAKGQVVEFKPGMITGGYAIESLLRKVDVKKDLEAAKTRLNEAPKGEVDKVLKKVKYLQALDTMGMAPTDAYVMRNLPVIPPALRPASPMQDGNVKYADMNQLYMNVGLNNAKLGDEERRKTMPHEEIAKTRKATYQGLKGALGFGVRYDDAEHKGLLHQIAGPNPKSGYFQGVLMNKAQDLSMRSTIVPEPSLGLDEVGLPVDHALDLFRPFAVKKLVEMGMAKDPIAAHKELVKKSPAAIKALDKAMEERPVLLKRDPVLHKYGIQGFNARRAEGNAIQIHPLVCGGFNADFDGDAMSAFLPITKDAIAEAHKMKPTANLFAESTGEPMYKPSLESAMGLYKLSMTGATSNKRFRTHGDVLEGVRAGKIKHTDIVRVGGKQTTAGRILLSTAVPEPLQNDVLYNLNDKLDGKNGISNLLTRIGKEHEGDYNTSVNKLKDMGNMAAFGLVPVPLPNTSLNTLVKPQNNVYIPVGAHTLGLSDFQTDKEAKRLALDPAHEQAKKIRANKKLTKAQQDEQIVALYDEADEKMKQLHLARQDESKDNLFLMQKAEIKPKWEQYKQLRVAPMVMMDSQRKKMPTPMTRSYGEGTDVAEYWIGMHGARRGTVGRVRETQDPGVISKALMQTMMDTLITSPDCGSNRGVAMTVHEKDINDRVLAKDFRVGNIDIKAGTVLTPDLLNQVKAVDKDAKLVVRSPLKCCHGKGLCQKCAGLASSGNFHDLGTNIGALSAQTLGERAVQLPMKIFHSGGVASGSGGLSDSFVRLEQLLELPKKIPNAAALATTDGTITKIEPNSLGTDIYINGVKHFVGKDTTGRSLTERTLNATYNPPWEPPKVGMKVEAGYKLSDPSRTVLNIKDYYKATKSIDKTQNEMVSEIYNLYKDEGIKRRHVETIVKSMSSMTEVQHPGDNDNGILRGEFQPLARVQAINDELVKAGKKPIKHNPALQGIDKLPLIQQTDWMAKMQHQKIRTTIAQAAATRGVSNIHGAHPIPGLAYGAEFGLTEEQSLKPGMGHLKNVKKIHY